MEHEVYPRLSTQKGVRLLLTDHNCLIGRHPSCDLILTNPHASNYQVLLHYGIGGLEMLVLGRAVTLLNEQPVARRAALKDGDRISLPGEQLTIHIPEDCTATSCWAVQLKGATIGLRGPQFTIGGSPSDNLFADGLPPRAISLTASREHLLVELNHLARLNGIPAPIGSVVAASSDVLLTCEQHTLHIISEHFEQDVPTLISGILQLPTVVSFSFLPKGGELKLHITGQVFTVQFSELRARLLAALLQPTQGFVAGDFIPDEQLINRIWPRQSNKDRVDLNTLIHRTRKTLEKECVSGSKFLQRSRGGHATRFLLAPNAQISVL